MKLPLAAALCLCLSALPILSQTPQLSILPLDVISVQQNTSGVKGVELALRPYGVYGTNLHAAFILPDPHHRPSPRLLFGLALFCAALLFYNARKPPQ